MSDLNITIGRATEISRGVANRFDRRMRTAAERYAKRLKDAGLAAMVPPSTPRTPLDVWQDAWQYGIDNVQRSVLFWDTLRQRGNNYLAHEAAGKPPLLHHEWELLADARAWTAFKHPNAAATLEVTTHEGRQVIATPPGQMDFDGGAAARFLNDVIDYLKAPGRLLLAP